MTWEPGLEARLVACEPVLAGAVVAAAVMLNELRRLTHHCGIGETDNVSWRFKNMA